MKLNKAHLILAAFVAVALVGCKNDDPNDTSFDNKVYIEANVKTFTLLIKPNNVGETKVIKAAVAKPATQQIDLLYKADLSKVATYNMAYSDQAIELTGEYYEIPETKAIIPAGGVKSTDISVVFKDINKLDRKNVYVLPVTLVSATNIGMLESARTVYYVIKAGAVINVVADIAENHLKIAWKDRSVCNNLEKITMEALVRPRAYEKISSVMGIEGTFLMRIGDSDRDQSQLQMATNRGNFPAPNNEKNLPKNEWIHIAVTMDCATGEYVIYINGKEQSSGTGPQLGSVDLGVDGFYIGKSYDDKRWLDGEISECRIWNIIRTADQVALNALEVDPNSEGLVAYWKFDDGAGTTVKDHTANGNNAVAKGDVIKWTPVSLPE